MVEPNADLVCRIGDVEVIDVVGAGDEVVVIVNYPSPDDALAAARRDRT